LEEAVKSHRAEYVAQKTRKEVEAKVREKAERRRVAEDKKRRREYWSTSNNSGTRC